MSALVYRTAAETAALIREKGASALEVVDAHLEQIAKHNPQLNAIVTLDAENARQRARAVGMDGARARLPAPSGHGAR